MEDEGNTVSEMCIICLSTLKSMEAIWSCGQCYCVFHLSCIHSWAHDSLHTRSRALSTTLFPNQAQLWSCPKCRRDYSTIPSHYMCFCGKLMDPPFDAWLSPHSCGEVCSRRKSHCPHSCTTLCHPGACPPCPKTVSVSCYCGKSPSQVKRCGAGGWSCGSVCSRVLSCGLHTCELTCHPDECAPCSQPILTSCVCGRASKECPCETDIWSCEKPCLKPFSCGHHYCQKVCHSGACGECPLSLPRTCPCTKTKHDLPCIMDTPTCDDSCDALLTCGRHHCTRRCHHGDCGQCIQVCERPCRCGKRRKCLPCAREEWLCESKCQRLRNCQNHSCRRKCCDGACPQCEAVCGKSLSCRKHKCSSPCHQGRCYPCIATVRVSCVCGGSHITVPCGQERNTQAPSCERPCTLPSCCLHPHTCHPPPCAPCTKPCGSTLNCGHTCKALCHSTPKPKVRPRGLAPWVKMVDSNLVRGRCPPCSEAVRVVCVGGHESQLQPCSEQKQYSCTHRCGRSLACGNHTCQLNCHQIIQPLGEQMAGRDCVECVERCTRPRSPGCPHVCPRSCHTGDCPDCVVLVKVPCHCRTLTLLIKCCEWATADGGQEHMCCCGGQCTRKLTCGHSCPLTCHSGQCVEVCNRKVTSRCPCGRRKKEVLCSSDLQIGVTCDTECERVAVERAQVLEAERELSRAQETAQQERALLEAQRQSQPRRRRRKTGRGVQEMATPTRRGTSGLIIIALLLTTGILITIGILLTLYTYISV